MSSFSKKIYQKNQKISTFSKKKKKRSKKNIFKKIKK